MTDPALHRAAFNLATARMRLDLATAQEWDDVQRGRLEGVRRSVIEAQRSVNGLMDLPLSHLEQAPREMAECQARALELIAASLPKLA